MPSIIETAPFPPPPEPFNMADYVLAAGRATPDKIALALVRPDGADNWSYARLERAVLGTATGLLAAGLGPGDRVLLRLGDGVGFPIAYLAAIAAGIIPIPTSVQLTRAEITRVAEMLCPRLTLASDGVALPDGAKVMGEADLTGLRKNPPASYRMGAADRPGYIILTSGTGGAPRAVMHAHRAVWARRMMWAGWYGLAPDDRLLHAGAFNWTYTLGTGLMDPWAAGATALIQVPGTGVEALPGLLRRHDATIFAAAPGVFRQLLRASGGALDLPRLRHGLSAGEKLHEAIREAWDRASGTALHEAYGQSECSTFVSGAPDRPAPTGTVGYAQSGRRVAVLDGDGHPVARGQAGKMAVHASDPGLMLGYSDADGVTLPLTGDWFLTGDTVSMSAGGAITYLGRDDDIINAGGFRVSPVEVEAALAEHAGVDEAAVSEVEVKPGVRVIAAWYTGAAEIDTEKLAAHAATRLARYKTPRIFIHINSLPRGGNGKLLRRQLRAAYRGGHDKT